MEEVNFGISAGKSYKKIQIIESGGIKMLMLNDQAYMSWRSSDQITPRTAIIQLYKLGLCNQEELAKSFNVHINTISNYISSFNANGIEGLLDRQRGPRKSWKLVPRLKAEILRTVLVEGITTYERIQKRLEDKGEKVSIGSIYDVLVENGFIKGMVKIDESFQGNFFKEEEKRRNEQLGLPLILGDKEQAEEIENNNEIEKSDEIDFGFSESLRSNIKKEDRSDYSRGERMYIDLLKRGGYNSYGGGLLFAPLLKRYSFLSTIKEVIKKIKTYEGYCLKQLCLTLFYFDIFGFCSIENFKTVYAEEFGILIGKLNSPSIYTLRRFLYKVKELNKGEELMEKFGKIYLKEGLVKWGVLYIDEHFLPYYGIETITMGWYTICNKPLKGSYNFISVDEEYNPFIFLIRSSSEDLIEKIPEIIIKAKKIAKETGFDNNRLVVIFDREGYCAELFRRLDDEKEESHARFISWAKYADEWVNDFKEEEFKSSIMIKYKIQESDEVKYFETERTMSKYGKIRAIVIQSGRKKKRTAIYTNDKESPAEDIIQLICTRWGQENLHKALKINHYIDYYPGKGVWESEEVKEQPMVENPEINKLKQERGILVNRVNKLKVKIADKILTMSDDEANWDNIKRKKTEIVSDIVMIESQITLLDQKIDKLPNEIKFEEAHDGRKLFKLDYEKKRFMDCIKIFAYHMQKQMCNILLNYYDKKKEIWPAMEMIIRRGANVKLEDGELAVRLKRFKDLEIDYAARCLCEELNQMEPHTLDKFQFPIHYEVE